MLAGARMHGSELANAFASLRPNELVWNYVVSNYLKGRTPPAFDLLFWNGDSANLAGPMYAYYLRHMYLDNRLRERGALSMCGEAIDLSRVAMPSYVYASHDDHIVPWRSAYRNVELLGGDATFVLGASGHIAGVVNPPGREQAPLLDQRPAHRRAGRLARRRAIAAGFVVAALDGVAVAPRRRAARGADAPGQRAPQDALAPHRDAMCRKRWSERAPEPIVRPRPPTLTSARVLTRRRASRPVAMQAPMETP